MNVRLKTSGVLSRIQKNEVRGARAKLEDVVYTLTASREFTAQIKAANKRQSLSEEGKTITVDKAEPDKRR